MINICCTRLVGETDDTMTMTYVMAVDSDICDGS